MTDDGFIDQRWCIEGISELGDYPTQSGKQEKLYKHEGMIRQKANMSLKQVSLDRENMSHNHVSQDKVDVLHGQVGLDKAGVACVV